MRSFSRNWQRCKLRLKHLDHRIRKVLPTMKTITTEMAITMLLTLEMVMEMEMPQVITHMDKNLMKV